MAVTVLDLGAANTGTAGTWYPVTGRFDIALNGDYFVAVPTGYAYWTFTGLTPGVAHRLAITYSLDNNLATDNVWSVRNGSATAASLGSGTYSSYAATQGNPAGDTTYLTRPWVILGASFVPTGTSLTVRVDTGTVDSAAYTPADAAWCQPASEVIPYDGMLVAGTITAGTITATSASLSCTAATAGTAPYTYQWYRSTTSGFTPAGGSLLAGATALALADTGLTPGTDYYYQLVASDSASGTATTAEVHVQTPALTHTTTGLLYLHDGTMTGWSGDTAMWTALSGPVFMSTDPSLDLMGSGSTYDTQGAREGQILVDDDGSYILVYDSGDGVTGWRTFYATSPDGLTWTKQGELGPGLAKIGGGTWAAVANGFFAKFSGRYYLYRVLAGSTFSAPNTGLPNIPFSGDVWSATSLAGPWTAESTLPSGGWSSGVVLPGSVVFSGGTYHLFAQDATGQTLGRLTATAPGGPFTFVGSGIITGVNTLGNQVPENPKILRHAPSSSWLLFCNLIDSGEMYTRGNIVGISASLTDWSAATWYPIQVYGPTNSPHAIGVLAPVYRADGTGAIGVDGSIAVTFDGFPTGVTPGWHLGRHVRATNILPFTGGLTAPGGAGDLVEHRTYRAFTHGDCVIEYDVAYRAMNASGAGVRLEFRSAANTFANSYAIVVVSGGLALEKIVGGSGRGTFLATGPLSMDYPHPGDSYRIRVVLSGATIAAYMDGVLHWTYTDSSSPFLIGSYLAINTQGGAVDVWGLRVYSGTSAAITGLPASASVASLWPGLTVPTGTVTADGSGHATLSATSYPAAPLAVNGVAAPADAAVYGGDTLAYSSGASGGFNPACVPIGATIGTGVY